MRLRRSEIPGQGVMWAGRNVTVYPPKYLTRFGPPRGDIPVGAWEVNLVIHCGESFLHSNPHRFDTEEKALQFLSEIFDEPVEFETAEQSLLA